MSIKADVQELAQIRLEIKSLNERKKKLREREKIIENKISDYLRLKDQPGVKDRGTAVIMEEKEVRAPKKARDRDADALFILEKYGVTQTEKALEELLEARRGQIVNTQKLKIKKYRAEN